jgi:hypothetical protein
MTQSVQWTLPFSQILSFLRVGNTQPFSLVILKCVTHCCRLWRPYCAIWYQNYCSHLTEFWYSVPTLFWALVFLSRLPSRPHCLPIPYLHATNFESAHPHQSSEKWKSKQQPGYHLAPVRILSQNTSSKKLKIELPYDPAILLLGIYPKEMRSLYQRDTWTSCLLQHCSQ